jgi:Tol biopolymer transport system component
MTRLLPRALVLAIIGAVLATAVLASTASATFPDRDGLLVFQAQTASGVQLFTMRPNGHGLRQITHIDGDALNPDWSPDGRRIAFAVNECSVGFVDPDGDHLTVIPPLPGDGVPGVDVCEGDPSFTPDGKRIVFIHFDFSADVEQVWSMNLDGSDRRVITGSGAPDPNVSPNGEKLSFKGEAGALFSTNLDGSGLKQISPTLDIAYKHDWAPDGRHLVISDNAEPLPGESVNIATVRPDGTGFQYLTNFTDGRRAFVGSYSPSGKWIVFRLEDNGRYALFRMRPDGGALHRLTPFSEFRPRGTDWGPASAH